MKYRPAIAFATAVLPLLAGAQTPPSPQPPTKWKQIATEGQRFNVEGTQRVRFGVAWADVWVTESMSGGGTCTVKFFSADPRPGSAKTCEVESGDAASAAPGTEAPQAADAAASKATVSTPTVATRTLPPPVAGAIGQVKINLNLIPKPMQNPPGGWAKDMLIPTTEVAPPSDIGAFRTGCQMAKMSFDDPIVFPGQPGRSHLHTFFGNTGIDANSTAKSIATSGNSTCRGGTINRSAYWVPTMIDTRTGAPLAPMFESNFYYKTGYSVAPGMIQPMPEGLRMIAGDASGKPETPSVGVSYACVWNGGNSDWQKSIPTDCPARGDSWLIMGVDFPQGWDGVNLDSPDHKSHMSNPVDVRRNNSGRCPSSHPVAIPQIAYQILYQVKVSGETRYWRLSSDDYDLNKPAGYSGHGDWFNGWKSEIVEVWVKNCDQAQKDCHSHLLGDGRATVIP